MHGKEFFSISSFAKFSRTTRDTLIYYDRIGLLHPVKRNEKGYRFYSMDQLALVNLIRTLQELGMSLDDIRQVSEHRTPELMCELLGAQIVKIDEKLTEWQRARKLLSYFQKIINSSLDVDRDEIVIKHLPAESLVMGGLNDYSKGGNDYDAMLDFYQAISEHYPDLDMNYPVWGHFSEERIKKGDWTWPDHYYFSNPDGPDKRPAGLYVIVYGNGGYGNNNELYKRMFNYVDANGYEICGPSWEEYPLNEISVPDPEHYLMRIIIAVREK